MLNQLTLISRMPKEDTMAGIAGASVTYKQTMYLLDSLHKDYRPVSLTMLPRWHLK
jgi:hypothetical protein